MAPGRWRDASLVCVALCFLPGLLGQPAMAPGSGMMMMQPPGGGMAGMPTSGASEAVGTTVSCFTFSQAAQLFNLDLLSTAVNASGLNETLDSGDITATIFAPTDAAFQALLDWSGYSLSELLEDPSLSDILLAHVLPNITLLESNLTSSNTSFTTLAGDQLTISEVTDDLIPYLLAAGVSTSAGDAVATNDASAAQIIYPSVRLCKLTIWAINAVLIPSVPDIADAVIGGSARSTDPVNSTTDSPVFLISGAETEGPYWIDEGLNRTNITMNADGTGQQGGTPLRLVLTIIGIEGETAAPLVGAMIDIWHCNATGAYSDQANQMSEGSTVVTTTNQTFLRGFQITNSSGMLHFDTIFPGWYTSRVTHIHVRARTYANSTATEPDTNFTTQLFFDDALTDAVYSNSPYTTGRDVKRNIDDKVFSGGDESGVNQLVTLEAMGSGYAGHLQLSVPVGSTASAA